ncbi:uncharacterized protein T551_03412 [Pneumocystis jirovecii RU7]|uniref:Uncharacterized protein n=1 Tax=Pneumocystis jirovecii (strain RU7) TaxID=1408657 RepID=A0A0W4ZDM8_PNEJ7|nr:uncharacterized protein T551_03412 [Pneumocystis jirovecii RU7]KTW26495.1 hypothetical protein T551_03412 [Pneumocystis jirovecii RU7]
MIMSESYHFRSRARFSSITNFFDRVISLKKKKKCKHGSTTSFWRRINMFRHGPTFMIFTTKRSCFPAFRVTDSIDVTKLRRKKATQKHNMYYELNNNLYSSENDVIYESFFRKNGKKVAFSNN